jgi:excisionase family DNA binding protein
LECGVEGLRSVCLNGCVVKLVELRLIKSLKDYIKNSASRIFMKYDLEELKKDLYEIKFLLEEKLVKPLTVVEAAKHLQISQSYLYKLSSKGQIKTYKPSGKLLFFRVEDLNAWAFRYESKTITELK